MFITIKLFYRYMPAPRNCVLNLLVRCGMLASALHYLLLICFELKFLHRVSMFCSICSRESIILYVFFCIWWISGECVKILPQLHRRNIIDLLCEPTVLSFTHFYCATLLLIRSNNELYISTIEKFSPHNQPDLLMRLISVRFDIQNSTSIVTGKTIHLKRK